MANSCPSSKHSQISSLRVIPLAIINSNFSLYGYFCDDKHDLLHAVILLTVTTTIANTENILSGTSLYDANCVDGESDALFFTLTTDPSISSLFVIDCKWNTIRSLISTTCQLLGFLYKHITSPAGHSMLPRPIFKQLNKQYKSINPGTNPITDPCPNDHDI